MIRQANFELQEEFEENVSESVSVSAINEKLGGDSFTPEVMARMICLLDEMTEQALCKLDNEDFVIDNRLTMDRFGLDYAVYEDGDEFCDADQ